MARPMPLFPLSRKILCSAVALLTLAQAPAPATASPPRLLRAELSQAGRSLVFTLRTSKPVALSRLGRGQRPGRRYLCLALRRPGGRGERRICLGARRDRAGLVLLNAAGEATARQALRARLRRPDPDKLVLVLLPPKAGLRPHRYRWRVLAELRDCRGGAAGESCEEDLPAHGARLFRLRPVRRVGCTPGGAGLVTNGPRSHPVVALTFDDGPSDYTPGFLDVLREKRVHGTFFEIGQEMPGREATMRRIMREGHEIGNHTTHHTALPGIAQIAPTTSLAESITHFRPCLFRPPGGAVDSAVLSAAAADGLRAINWDVDPVDWSTPGSGAVYSRVVSAARPGSIILMHDGGGDRSGTLAALPAIIDTLRARGYRFATVTELLGQRFLYRPYG